MGVSDLMTEVCVMPNQRVVRLYCDFLPLRAHSPSPPVSGITGVRVPFAPDDAAQVPRYLPNPRLDSPHPVPVSIPIPVTAP
jgi:hypothetical protein